MKERPILFNAEMVRALLDGRKTQTRRVMKPMSKAYGGEYTGWVLPEDRDDCPYGKPGDRLWVRETFRCNGWATDVATIFYRANERNSYSEMCEQFPIEGKKPLPVDGKWRPSIHMPRWASRITLEITDVRVERLNDISEEDALAEGCVEGEVLTAEQVMSEPPGPERELGRLLVGGRASAKLNFMFLWESINGGGSWDANPWVWVVEFKRIDA